MAIVTNGRLEYEMDKIDVDYPDIGKVTYNGSYPVIVPNNWAPPEKEIPIYDDCVTFVGDNNEDFLLYFEYVEYYDTLWYSIDHENWIDFSNTNYSANSKNGILFVRGNCSGWQGRGSTILKATKKLECYGNIIAVTNYDTASNSVIFKNCVFVNIFRNIVLIKANIFKNLRLVNPSDLPTYSCGLDFIFYEQKELLDIDEIPYFKNMSYISMCSGCEKLKVKIGRGSKKLFSIPENLDGRDLSDVIPLTIFRDTAYYTSDLENYDINKIPGVTYYLE